MPAILLSDIAVSPRLRFESYGDLSELALSMSQDGQLQSVLVRPRREGEDLKRSGQWVLVDGGRRFGAALLLSNREEAILGLEVGAINAEMRSDQDDDEIDLLRLEHDANYYRESFSWRETAKYCQKAHELLMKRGKERDVNWDIPQTAQYLRMGHRQLRRYLELVEDDEVFESDEVQEADSFRTAHKKVQIARDKKRRKAQVELRKETEEKGTSPQLTTAEDYFGLAAERCYHGDCREWLKTTMDNHFDWFHWDPPYGGEQSGGAFSVHEQIDDSSEYAHSLIDETLPEIYRTLRPGGWFVIWFHQAHRRGLLEALTEVGFWVNPYECIWFKENRKADGHEITRFLINAYEPFFLCAKPHEDPSTPIVLARSDRQNVFVSDMITKANRRHPMHKPAFLLKEIIEIISIEGELGGDASAGSGSIVTAAHLASRDIEVCELSEGYHLMCVEMMAQGLLSRGVALEDEEDMPEELSL